MFSSIGVCGVGNMGRAIVKGLVQSGVMAPAHIYLYNIHKEKAQKLADEVGAVVVDSAEELAACSQAIIMAVKPRIMAGALDIVKSHIGADTVVISIAAGLTISDLAAHLPERTKIVRIMPNTPAWWEKVWRPYLLIRMFREEKRKMFYLFSAALGKPN